jgi:hypothetical protein
MALKSPGHAVGEQQKAKYHNVPHRALERRASA